MAPVHPISWSTLGRSVGSSGRAPVQPLAADDWDTALCWNMVVPAGVRAALFMREIDADDVVSTLTVVPVLVVHGRSDAIVLPSMAQHVLDICDSASALRGTTTQATSRSGKNKTDSTGNSETS